MTVQELEDLLFNLEPGVKVKDIQAALKKQSGELNESDLAFDVMMSTKPNPVLIAAGYGWSNADLVKLGFDTVRVYNWAHGNTCHRWLGLALEYWMRTHDAGDELPDKELTTNDMLGIMVNRRKSTVARQLGVTNTTVGLWMKKPPAGIDGKLLREYLINN